MIERRGTYKVYANLLFIKMDDGQEYINSFHIESFKECDFLDRESFLPEFEFVKFSFEKISEKFPKD